MPLSANVTNTVALVFNSVGSVSASRPELAGQRHRLRSLLPAAVLGGVVGAVLLLVTPAGAFAGVVPFLIAAAALAVLYPRPVSAVGDPAPVPRRWVVPGVFGIGVYGGYFGAAAGVLLLAVLLVAYGDTVPRSNALKNLVLGAANGIAALGFVLSGRVVWSAMLPLALGLFLGGRLGPRVVRRADPGVLRTVIATAGLGLAAVLAWQRFG